MTREVHLVKRFARPTPDERRFTVDVSRAVAEVVEWQTRTFEGRVAKAVRVQVPPSAPSPSPFELSSRPNPHMPVRSSSK